MEKTDIIIRKVAVHILDNQSGFIKTSNALMETGPDLNDFLRGHIFRLLDSDDTKKCKFHTVTSEMYQMLKSMDEKNEEQFIRTTKNLAERLFEIMCESIEIPAADLICVSFQMESQIYLALLKMNYKDSYIHHRLDDGQNDIRKQYVIPSAGGKLTEAVIANLGTMDIRLVEKKYDVEGEKINYLSERFLMCYTELASKKKFNILTKNISDVINKYDGMDLEKKLKTKNQLHKQFEESKGFNVNDISQTLFGDNAEKKKAFDQKMERYDMQYDDFSVIKESTVKKLEKQVIITDTGVKIEIPMEEYDRKDNIVITREPNGTSTITIRNIGDAMVK